MTPKELREKAEPILLRDTTPQQKQEELKPLVARWFKENILIMTEDEMFEAWNNIMVDILQEHNQLNKGLH